MITGGEENGENKLFHHQHYHCLCVHINIPWIQADLNLCRQGY